jgi:hypothetical protein
VYYGTYAADPDSLLAPASDLAPSLWMLRIGLVTPDGSNFVMTYQIGTIEQRPQGFYTLRGSFGCANGLMEISLADYPQDCTEEPGTLISGLCNQYLPNYCSGTFPYTTYRDGDGIYKIEIDGLCSMKSIATLACVDNSCGGIVQCSSSFNQIVLQNGNVIANDTVVIVDGGASGNVTNIFYGDTIQVMNSRNITIQSPAEEIEININNSTAIVQSQANATYLNTGPIRTCGDWITFIGITGNNVSLTSTPVALTFGSVSVDTGDGATTWQDFASAVQYVAESNGASYSFTYCIERAKIYNAVPEGQYLGLELYNVTGTPAPINAGSFATSAVFYNHTNPAAVTSVCATLIADDIKQSDIYQLYLSSFTTAGTSVPLILSDGAAFMLSIQPTGCSGVLNNITFNITVEFANGTLIKAGKCMAIETDAIDGSFEIDNEGLCTAIPNAENFPTTCSWGEIDDGTLDLKFSGVCAAGVNSGTPVGGVLNFRNTTTVADKTLKPLHCLRSLQVVALR